MRCMPQAGAIVFIPSHRDRHNSADICPAISKSRSSGNVTLCLIDAQSTPESKTGASMPPPIAAGCFLRRISRRLAPGLQPNSVGGCRTARRMGHPGQACCREEYTSAKSKSSPELLRHHDSQSHLYSLRERTHPTCWTGRSIKPPGSVPCLQ